jgi:hypothetical protein
VIADGTDVRLGDVVAVERGHGRIVDVVANGWPVVQLSTGRLGVHPLDVLARVRRGSAAPPAAG